MSRAAAFLASAGLAVLAVSQPLYALLHASPEYFAARGAGNSDIVLTALLVLVPALLWGAAAAPFGTAGLRASAGLAAALLAAQAASGLNPAAAVLAASTAGALAVRYSKTGTAREFLVWTAVAAAACPLLFLARAPWPGRAPQAPPSAAGGAPPVLMLVLDELPLATLLAEDGSIDAAWFPSFARLSREAAWYREARTVSDDTFKAVPALLTGELPRPPKAPWWKDYPRSIFTELAPTHTLAVVETHTSLCPPSLCRPAEEPWRAQLADLAVLYAHRTVPRRWTGALPSISHSWKGFSWSGLNSKAGESFLDRAGAMDAFIAGASGGGFRFLHVMLPHPPWVYLPSGKAAFAPNEPIVIGDNGRDDRWEGSEAVVHAAWQRHILQARFTDRLIGRLLDALRAGGRWDDAVLVVAADHGASFRTGSRRRLRTDANAGEVVPIPLFIKYPKGGPRGPQTVSASVLDVLPSVLDALSARIPDGLDGRSLLASGPRPSAPFLLKDGRPIPAAEGWPAARREADRRRKLLGDGRHPDRLYRIGPAGGLVGKRTADLPSAGGACALELERPAGADARTSPAYVYGRLTCAQAPDQPVPVVAAARGRIVASGLSGGFSGAAAMLRMMVPEESAAEAEFFAVKDGRLSPISLGAPAWRMSAGALRDAKGAVVPVLGRRPGLITQPEKDVLTLRGRAGAPGAVLVFRGEALLYAGRSEGEQGRFDFALPRDLAGDGPGLRVFAVADGGAWELSGQ
ncbi:MAG: sulfatase-like hydrolase/transferase [Elusimicrobia bacterium]|nr:sulfatase-like hydrolase/transferase [Elusimicrobiota bacterium]